MTHSTLTRLERDALMLRNSAALRLLRSDPTLTPEEALLMVVAPSTAVRAASLRAAAFEREVRADEHECRSCHHEVDESGYCDLCGLVSLDAAVIA